jgi:hypothetical protein
MSGPGMRGQPWTMQATLGNTGIPGGGALLGVACLTHLLPQHLRDMMTRVPRMLFSWRIDLGRLIW